LTGRPHGRGIRHVDLTDAQPASSETARRINRDIVLEIIREEQPISRAGLARRSGLQRSTVSQIVEQLIREKWVREGPQASAARGRRPTMLVLNEDLLVIAVDLHPGQATVATVDLNGRILTRSKAVLTRDPEASTRVIVEAMRRLLNSHSDAPEGKTIEGIGMSMPGRIDPATERLIFAPNLHWQEYDVKGVIEKAMQLPVRMENAANACLLAELIFGNLDGNRDVVLVTVSEGVGTSVFANGRLIGGHQGMAGEFGHITLDASGPKCACGRTGCWEVFASCRAALRYYHELEPNPEPETRATSFAELLHLAESGNARAAQAVERQAKCIGDGLRMIIAALAPGTILIAGDITSAWHRYGPVIERAAGKQTLAGSAPRILPAHDGDQARLRGAAALVFQRRPANPGKQKSVAGN
jgi:predicted NBD/HSP70 family sugar kinase